MGKVCVCVHARVCVYDTIDRRVWILKGLASTLGFCFPPKELRSHLGPKVKAWFSAMLSTPQLPLWISQLLLGFHKSTAPNMLSSSGGQATYFGA